MLIFGEVDVEVDEEAGDDGESSGEKGESSGEKGEPKPGQVEPKPGKREPGREPRKGEPNPGKEEPSAGPGKEDKPRVEAVEFVREVLGEEPYGKQVEILEAVHRHRRVSVVGCNGSGKDWTAARVVLWWVNAFRPAKAIVTGPTTRQVSEIVWREMQWAYAWAPQGKLKGKMFRTSRYEVDAETFALGFATDSPYNLQGFHSPNLLVVVTEAHAVDERDMDAIRRLHPRRLLLVGNAYVSPGTFYDSHHSKRHLYEAIRISAEDTPNFTQDEDYIPGMMTRQDVADREAEWGRDDPRFLSTVLAKFPENQDDIVVPLEWARAAAERSLEPDGPVILACDVARFGGDKTVVVRRQGAQARIVRKIKGQDTMEIADYLKGYCDGEKVDFVVVDETGVGGGVVDRLRQLRLRGPKLVPFLAGASASNPRYHANRGAEVWWVMRNRYQEGDLDTDDDADLIEQVSTRKFFREGERIKLDDKYKLRRSPDEADALAMTFAVRTGRVRIWV